jgi:hypothetical protein
VLLIDLAIDDVVDVVHPAAGEAERQERQRRPDE